MTGCKCVGKHVPLPMLGYDIEVAGETITVCPTTYENIKDLYAKSKNGNLPDGWVRKHYSRYVREIVRQMLID